MYGVATMLIIVKNIKRCVRAFRWGGLLLLICYSYSSRNIFNASNVRVCVAADHGVGGIHLPVQVKLVNDCEYTASPILSACIQRKYDILMMPCVYLTVAPKRSLGIYWIGDAGTCLCLSPVPLPPFRAEEYWVGE